MTEFIVSLRCFPQKESAFFSLLQVLLSDCALACFVVLVLLAVTRFALPSYLFKLLMGFVLKYLVKRLIATLKTIMETLAESLLISEIISISVKAFQTYRSLLILLSKESEMKKAFRKCQNGMEELLQNAKHYIEKLETFSVALRGANRLATRIRQGENFHGLIEWLGEINTYLRQVLIANSRFTSFYEAQKQLCHTNLEECEKLFQKACRRRETLQKIAGVCAIASTVISGASVLLYFTPLFGAVSLAKGLAVGGTVACTAGLNVIAADRMNDCCQLFRKLGSNFELLACAADGLYNILQSLHPLVTRCTNLVSGLGVMETYVLSASCACLQETLCHTLEKVAESGQDLQNHVQDAKERIAEVERTLLQQSLLRRRGTTS